MNTVVLIPAYNPDDKLLTLVEQLSKLSFPHIVIVNDGSDSSCNHIFQKLTQFNNCTVINQEKNYGKGMAMKVGFKHIIGLNSTTPILGCVTCDADGQHLSENILDVAMEFEKDPTKLVLGCRNFKNGNVPFRSRLGNMITENVYRIFSGKHISDTQTGLRALSISLMNTFLTLKGDRYEFEMNMLMEAVKLKISIKEVTINTVYIEDNKSSHFNPIFDGIKIYWQILSFSASSLASSVIDVGIYTILVYVLGMTNFPYKLFISTGVARITSSIFNFIFNKQLVFGSKEKFTAHLWKYYVLCILQWFLSYLMLKGIYAVLVFDTLTLLDKTIVKMCVDVFLFFISFRIQRKFVF